MNINPERRGGRWAKTRGKGSAGLGFADLTPKGIVDHKGRDARVAVNEVECVVEREVDTLGDGRDDAVAIVFHNLRVGDCHSEIFDL